MNTRWLKFRDVLHEVAATQNLDVAEGQLDSAVVQRRLAQAVNMAVDFVWKFHLWPEAAWLYYQTGSADMSLVFPPGFSVVQVYAEDPLAKWEAGSAPVASLPAKLARWREFGGTVRRQSDDPVWMVVRIPAPEFGVDARTTTTAYVPGDKVYDAATGECWVCQKGHTNEALPSSWAYWKAGKSYSENDLAWHGGWLFKRNGAAGDYEPHYDENWPTTWSYSTVYWRPVRLPGYLLRAVLAGARAWLESPDTEAMERAMQGALGTEIHDFTYTRQQGGHAGATGPLLP